MIEPLDCGRGPRCDDRMPEVAAHSGQTLGAHTRYSRLTLKRPDTHRILIWGGHTLGPHTRATHSCHTRDLGNGHALHPTLCGAHTYSKAPSAGRTHTRTLPLRGGHTLARSLSGADKHSYAPSAGWTQPPSGLRGVPGNTKMGCNHELENKHDAGVRSILRCGLCPLAPNGIFYGEPGPKCGGRLRAATCPRVWGHSGLGCSSDPPALLKY